MGLKWRNSGQACISANRVYVQANVYQQFAEIISQRTSKLVVGHGNDAKTTLGPVTTPQSLDRVLGQIQDAKRKGAHVLLGGKRLTANDGFFLQPTIIGDATKEMKVSDEESFAPILALFKFTSEAEAVELANDTPVSPRAYHVGLSDNNVPRWVWRRTFLPKIWIEHGGSLMSWKPV